MTSSQIEQHAEHAPLDDETLFERRMRAMTLRNGGATYTQIAERCGTSATQARNDVTWALRHFASESAEDLIARQRSVLHDLQRAHYVRAMSGDKDSSKVVIECLEHEAKLLGLYAPQRMAIGITDTEFARDAAELIADLRPEVFAELQSRAQTEGTGDDIIDTEIVSVIVEDETPKAPEPWADI